MVKRIFWSMLCATVAFAVAAQNESLETKPMPSEGNSMNGIEQVSASNQQTWNLLDGRSEMGVVNNAAPAARSSKARRRAGSITSALTAVEMDYDLNDSRTARAIITTKAYGTNQAYIYNMWGYSDTLQATYDLSAKTISITPGQIATHATYGPIWICAYDASNNTFSDKNPINGTINDDGSVTLSGWGVFVVEGTYRGGAFARYKGSDWLHTNATMTDTIYNGSDATDVSNVISYPVYVDSVSRDQIQIVNFTSNGAIVNATLNADKTVTIDPQRILSSSAYGDFYCYAANWTTKTYGGSIEAQGSSNRIELGQWIIYSHNGYSMYARGYLGSSITLDEGYSFTYPEPKALDWSGNGTQSSPYTITTVNQWQAFAASVNGGNTYQGKYIALGSDLDFSSLDETYRPVGKSSTKYFDGIFNGNGHTISGLYYSAGDVAYQGLFGYTGTNSVLNNLVIRSCKITSYGDFTGLLVGLSLGNISDIDVSGVVYAYKSFSGGIMGGFQGNIAKNLTFNGTVQGSGETGGIVGEMMGGTLDGAQVTGIVRTSSLFSSTYKGLGGVVGGCIHKADYIIRNCMNAAMITDNSQQCFTGGVVGDLYNATLENSFNVGGITGYCSMSTAIDGTINYNGALGGVAGRVYGSTMTNCFNSNIVVNSGNSLHVGGIFGYIAKPITTYSGGGIIGIRMQSRATNCYNSGQVYASTMHASQGIYGFTYADSTLENCYFDQQMTGNVMEDPSSATIKTTAELTSGNALEGWSTDVWNFTAGVYPELKIFSSQPLSKLAISPVTFAKGENTRKVKTDFVVSSANNIGWKIYDSSTESFVTSSKGLVISGDSVKLNHVNSSEIIVGLINGNDSYIKMLMIETVDPTAFRGSGTEDDPYLISDKDDLIQLNTCVSTNQQSFEGDYFKQTNDIDIDNATDFVGVANDNVKTHPFSGTYDGQGYSIHRLNIQGVVVENGTASSSKSLTYAGLFGVIGEKGVVKNLNLASDCHIYGYLYIGGFAGLLQGKIENCKNYATVEACRMYVGGLAGYVDKTGVITSCYNAGSVRAGGSQAGGIAGITYGTVEKSQNDATIECCYMEDYPTTTQTSAGGIAGYMNSPAIVSDCVNTGTIIAANNTGGITSGAYSGTTMARNINYGVVFNGKPDDCYNGALSGRECSSGYIVANNYYDKQLGYYGAAGRAPYPGMNGVLTRELTSGTPLDSLDANLYDWQKGQYPVLKAFKDEAAAAANRLLVITLPDNETIDDVKSTGVLADTAAWALTTAQAFAIDGKMLNVTISGDSSLRDTLTATLGGYNKVITLRAMPKMFEGAGTQEDPFQIASKADMQKLARLTNDERYPFHDAYFKVLNDIDYDTTEYVPVSLNYQKFEGDFNGNGKKFLNINYTSTSTLSVEQFRGLFGNIGEGGRVHDVILQSGCIRSYGRGGGIAGRVYGTVENCENHAMVATTKDVGMGGIAGRVMTGGMIRSCKNYATFDYTSYNYIGGIAYDALNGATIENCENMVAMGDAKRSYVAGIVAQNGGIVRGCVNHADVTASGIAGGIVAVTIGGDSLLDCHNEGKLICTGANVAGILGNTVGSTSYKGTTYISGCSNTANITAKSQVGGILGYGGFSGYIGDCTNSGDITSTNTSTTSSSDAGGIIGKLSGANTITRCFNSGAVTAGGTDVGGIVGYNYGYSSTVSDCVNAGNIVGGNLYAAGISGTCYSTIERCYNYGNVESGAYAAGITGYAMRAHVNHCVNVGDIAMTGSSRTAANASGLVALGTSCYLYDSNNFGKVTGTFFAAGIMSDARSNSTYGTLEIKRCYNAGEVSGTTTAHVAQDGTNYTITTDSVYYDTEVNPSVTPSAKDQQCAGLTTREMVKAALGEEFVYGTAMYPVLKEFADSSIINWAAATVVLAEGDTRTNVQHPFSVGSPEGTTWVANPAIVYFDGNKATPTGLGEVTITKTYGNYSKSYKLNITAISGIDDMNADSPIVSTEYIGVNGINYGTTCPSTGIYFERASHQNGTTTTTKVVR